MYNELENTLTPQAEMAMQDHATHHAQSMGHNVTDTGHLLLGIMSPNPQTKEESIVARNLHNAFGITYGEVRRTVAAIDHVTTRFPGTPRNTPSVKKVLKRAAKFAKRDKKSGRYTKLVITRFHIAEALANVSDPMFLQVLEGLGLTREQFTNAVKGNRVLLTTAK